MRGWRTVLCHGQEELLAVQGGGVSRGSNTLVLYNGVYRVGQIPQ